VLFPRDRILAAPLKVTWANRPVSLSVTVELE
jgi:hypothetical protein